ncbi:ABC transporter ATP-binding protein [Actinomyces sp. 2119]|nr:ABC transporter ATP-binding protein [Actinomyces sp. 2119]
MGARGPSCGRCPSVEGLRVSNIARSYPDGSGGLRPVLDGVSLDLPAGHSAALLGRSGCGKTTLLRALLLLDVPGPKDSGEILLDGTPVLRRSARRLRSYRRVVQYVPQDAASSLDPRLRVVSQVTRPMRTLGVPGSREEHTAAAEDLLTRLELPRQVWHSRPHELSGGQAQRVAIARALAPAPRHLLLDEPVSGLDPALRRQVLELLSGIGADLADKETTAQPQHVPAEQQDRPAPALDCARPAPALLVVSHDLAAVARICSRGIVMDGGVLVEDAPMGDLLTAPSHPAARALRDAVPSLPSPQGAYQPQQPARRQT